MEIERISKTYYSSSNQDSVAVVIPKAIRDVLDIPSGSYVKWVCTVEGEEIRVSFSKV